MAFDVDPCYLYHLWPNPVVRMPWEQCLDQVNIAAKFEAQRAAERLAAKAQSRWQEQSIPGKWHEEVVIIMKPGPIFSPEKNCFSLGKASYLYLSHANWFNHEQSTP